MSKICQIIAKTALDRKTRIFPLKKHTNPLKHHSLPSGNDW